MKKCLHAFSKASSESNAQPLKLMSVVNSARTLKPFNFNLLNNKVEFFPSFSSNLLYIHLLFRFCVKD